MATSTPMARPRSHIGTGAQPGSIDSNRSFSSGNGVGRDLRADGEWSLELRREVLGAREAAQAGAVDVYDVQADRNTGDPASLRHELLCDQMGRYLVQHVGGVHDERRLPAEPARRLELAELGAGQIARSRRRGDHEPAGPGLRRQLRGVPRGPLGLSPLEGALEVLARGEVTKQGGSPHARGVGDRPHARLGFTRVQRRGRVEDPRAVAASVRPPAGLSFGLAAGRHACWCLVQSAFLSVVWPGRGHVTPMFGVSVPLAGY
jgi:hypothetical protein